jgi:hypothetical protein
MPPRFDRAIVAVSEEGAEGGGVAVFPKGSPWFHVFQDPVKKKARGAGLFQR